MINFIPTGKGITHPARADVRSYQRKHGKQMYVCECKSGRLGAEQDWRAITAANAEHFTVITPDMI